MAEQYPLEWPEDWDRTAICEQSRFGNRSIRKATKALHQELELLGARYVVISSNAKYKKDGDLYSNQPWIADEGVAVYFQRNDKPQCIPCDRWGDIADNVWAITKTISALRGLERWGAKTILDAAFSGFQALPPPEDGMVESGVVHVANWWEILGVERTSSIDDARAARNTLAKRYHPDNGTEPSHERMAEVNAAFAEAERTK